MGIIGKIDKYTIKIVRIICLTNIPAILTLPWFFSESIGWILGSLGSIVRFLWLSIQVGLYIDNLPSKAKTGSIKGFYQRFLFVIGYSVIVMWLVKPNIIMFGVGLLASQIAIYINEIYSRIKR